MCLQSNDTTVFHSLFLETEALLLGETFGFYAQILVRTKLYNKRGC